MVDGKDISLLHPALQRGATELIKRMKDKGYALAISSTYRDIERQNALYAQGRTTPGQIVTKAKGGQSMHNYKLAFDIIKNVRGEEYSDSSFFKTAGAIWTQMGGEWGGSWVGFSDTPHFQFTNGLTLSQLQTGATVALDAKMSWEKNIAITQPAVTSDTKGKQYTVVNVTTTLNIRSDSNIDADKVGTLKVGEKITITEIKNGYGKISNGWVNMNYVLKV